LYIYIYKRKYVQKECKKAQVSWPKEPKGKKKDQSYVKFSLNRFILLQGLDINQAKFFEVCHSRMHVGGPVSNIAPFLMVQITQEAVIIF
jgi:hypothetical protein